MTATAGRQASEPEALLEHYLATFGRLSDSDLIVMRAIWEDLDPAARKEAWAAGRRFLERSRRERLLAEARSRLATWVNGYEPAYRVSMASSGGSEGFDDGSVRKAAIPPMLDVLLAAIAADGLSESQARLLLEPLNGLRPEDDQP